MYSYVQNVKYYDYVHTIIGTAKLSVQYNTEVTKYTHYIISVDIANQLGIMEME